MSHADDVLILGGGVVGLSIAYEISQRGHRVRMVDIAKPNESASWAGAGILTPASSRFAQHPYEQLQALSYSTHAKWAAELLELTGIDNGFRRCGGLYVARSAGELASLQAALAQWSEEGISVQPLSSEELGIRFPELRSLASRPDLRRCWWVADEAQIRNPRHLRALERAAVRNGSQVHWSCDVHAIERDSRGRVQAISTSDGRFAAGQYVLAAGAWTYDWLSRLEISVSLLPIRGQMLLFRLPAPPFACIINQGSRYIVPRDDGHVLAGSTEEETGFKKGTTLEARQELLELAQACHPELNETNLSRQWSGLRPATLDGFPYLGRVPSIENLFVAAGHFRSGLFLSTGTAVVLADCLLAKTPRIDVTPFRVSRG